MVKTAISVKYPKSPLKRNPRPYPPVLNLDRQNRTGGELVD